MRQHRFYKGRGAGLVGEQLVALAAAAGVTLLLICAMAFLATKIDAGKSALSAMSASALTVGAYFGGYVGGRRRKRHGLAMGALTGFIIFLLILALGGIFVKTTAKFSPFGKLLLTVFAAAVGGAVGVNTKRMP